jgi:hypothetical protein
MCLGEAMIFRVSNYSADLYPGIRRQAEKGIPHAYTNSQILEYGGSPVSTANRLAGPCGPGSCCAGAYGF